MWNEYSATCGLCCNRNCMCHIARVPCLCINPMTQTCYNSLLLSSTSFPNYQNAPENTMYGFSHPCNPVNPPFHVENDQKAGEKMATKETDFWLVPNLYNNQVDESLNFPSYCSWTGNPDGQFDHMLTKSIQVSYNQNYGQTSRKGLVEQQEQTLKFSQEIQNDYSTSASLFYPVASLQPTGAGSIPEATIGTMNLPQEWALNQFSFLPFHPGNLEKETDGSHSNSTRISSHGTQQQSSGDDLKRPFQFPPLSRQERNLCYLEKKKSRKYQKKIIHSSRKAYAQTRPRVPYRAGLQEVLKLMTIDENNYFRYTALNVNYKE